MHNLRTSNTKQKRRETPHDKLVKVQTLIEEGKSCKYISRKLGLNENTVKHQIQRYNKRGTTFPAPRPGRPRITSVGEDDVIIQTGLENRFLGSERLKPIIRGILKKDISATTLRRRFAERHVKMKKGYKVPILNNLHKRNRILFAIKHKRKNWDRVIFSDEKIMQLHRQNGYIRIRKGEHPMLPTAAHPPKVMFWACFSVEGVSELIEVQGKMNGEKYKNVLKKDLYLIVKSSHAEVGLSCMIMHLHIDLYS